MQCDVDARNHVHVTFLSDHRQALPRTPVPSLILQCSDDMLAPPSIGEYMHQHTPGSTLRVMQATEHCPHISDPEATIALIREYLDA